jgi:pyrroline-5-carboxylate reductase
MGGALLEGWLRSALTRPRSRSSTEPLLAIDAVCRAAACGSIRRSRRWSRRKRWCSRSSRNRWRRRPGVDPIVGPKTLVISILAGKTVADLKRAIPNAGAIIRAMPNLPASIGRGATGAAASPETTERQRRLADALLSSVGVVEWLASETLIDAVTALSGSGPAYVFHLAECLTRPNRRRSAAGGRRAPRPRHRGGRRRAPGAERTLARDLARKRHVTGGTTAAALAVLMREGGMATSCARPSPRPSGAPKSCPRSRGLAFRPALR